MSSFVPVRKIARALPYQIDSVRCPNCNSKAIKYYATAFGEVCERCAKTGQRHSAVGENKKDDLEQYIRLCTPYNSKRVKNDRTSEAD